MTALQDAHRDYATSCLSAGLLISMGVDGLYGAAARSSASWKHQTLPSAGSAIRQAGRDAIPARIGKWQLEQSGYLKSSPQLVGTIHSFTGARSPITADARDPGEGR